MCPVSPCVSVGNLPSRPGHMVSPASQGPRFMTTLTKPDFVSIAEFCRRSSLSRTTVYAEIDRGNLPRPTRLTENRVAFPAPAVDAWFASREAA